MYPDAYSFIMDAPLQNTVRERKEAFNRRFPIDPQEDVIEEGQVEPDWYERVERHADELGSGTILAALLNELDGEYLLEMRANIHESQFVVTRI
jgi:hypothetical protein